jgi:hypothetical protein
MLGNVLTTSALDMRDPTTHTCAANATCTSRATTTGHAGHAVVWSCAQHGDAS